MTYLSKNPSLYKLTEHSPHINVVWIENDSLLSTIPSLPSRYNSQKTHFFITLFIWILAFIGFDPNSGSTLILSSALSDKELILTYLKRRNSFKVLSIVLKFTPKLDLLCFALSTFFWNQLFFFVQFTFTFLITFQKMTKKTHECKLSLPTYKSTLWKVNFPVNRLGIFPKHSKCLKQWACWTADCNIR